MASALTLEFWRAFWIRSVQVVISHGLLILCVIAGYYIVRAIIYRLIDSAIARALARHPGSMDERTGRIRTLQTLARSVVGYALLFVLIVMLLDAVGANVMGVITTAGVGGIAIGFGAQKLVKDVISGFFLIVEDQFVVGEYVSIGAATGSVEELGMRITRIRDDQGKLWIISNGDISSVTNHSRAPITAAVDVGVAHGADLKQAEQAIDAACGALYASERGELLAAPRVAGVSGWDVTHTVVRVVVTAQPRALASEQLRVRQAIYQRLHDDDIPVG